MKKQVFILLACLLLSAAMCMTVSWPQQEGTPLLPILSTRPTKPTTSSTQPSSVPEAPGVLRLYVCQREDVSVYEELAQQYSQHTGVECQILTGDLQTLMAGEDAPTIFCVHSQQEAARWADHGLDLTGNALLQQLYSQAFALQQEGKILGFAMDMDVNGLIYNAALLAKAGYTRTDITNFAELQAVVEYITIDRKVLGFQAFGTAVSDRRLASILAGMSRDPAQIRGFLDLYLANDKTGGVAMEQFVGEQTVFLIGGIGDYEALEDLGIHNLDILPLFTENGGGLHCVCDTYWCVNGKASQADVEVSLDFLAWLVNAGEDGTVPVDALGWVSPFAEANGAENALARLLRKYIVAEPVNVQWSMENSRTLQEWEDLAAAFAAYIATPQEETWAAVEALLQG